MQDTSANYDTLDAGNGNMSGKISGGNILGILYIKADGKNVASIDIHSALESLFDDQVTFRSSKNPANIYARYYAAITSKNDKPAKWNIGDLSRTDAEVRFSI